MAKLKRLYTPDGTFGSLAFECPGCGSRHAVNVTNPPEPEDPGFKDYPHWGWNGDYERPTLTPSVLVKTGHHCAGGPPTAECHLCRRAQEQGRPSRCQVCHSFVRDGRIQFLADSTHRLAGQTVELSEIDE